LSAEQSEELANEEGSPMAQKVKENVVKAAKKAMGLTEKLKDAAPIQVNEVLTTHMEVKREQGSSYVVASNVGF